MARCLVGRLFLFLGCLLLLGIVIRLVMAVFAPVILEAMQQGLVAGWEQLSGIMGPAIPAIAGARYSGRLCLDNYRLLPFPALLGEHR